MRREQYTLRDSYRQTMFVQNDAHTEVVSAEFDVEVEVLPFGLKQDSHLSSLIFRAWRELNPDTIHGEDDLQLISDLYWKKMQFAPGTYQTWIDFRELEHVYQLLNFFGELRDCAEEADFESNTKSLLDTLRFYVEQADLSEIQRDILDMKLAKKKNTDIAWDINHKYCKTYTPNYISTIFRQRIIPKINEAAKYHVRILENIYFEEEFKTCTCCGEKKLRCAENFTRKSRANDGLSSRCKKCEKRIRQGDK